MSTLPSLAVKDGRIVATSLSVAQDFGKLHKDVLRAIRNLDCSEDFNRRNFALCFEISVLQNGKRQPCYEITRDGFTFLAMGFTGKEAAAWKERYIAAFNMMEAALLGGRQPAPTQPFPDSGSPFDNVQASKLGKLMRLNKSAAFAYLIECGVTPEYIQDTLRQHDALPALPARADMTQAAPLDYLADAIPQQADREDEGFWYLLKPTFARLCGDYDPRASARLLRSKGLLRINTDGLSYRAYRGLFADSRPLVFAVRKGGFHHG